MAKWGKATCLGSVGNIFPPFAFLNISLSFFFRRRNTLGSKLHKEIIELSDVLENESAENESQLEVKLKKVDQIIRTANTLQQVCLFIFYSIIAY